MLIQLLKIISVNILRYENIFLYTTSNALCELTSSLERNSSSRTISPLDGTNCFRWIMSSERTAGYYYYVLLLQVTAA